MIKSLEAPFPWFGGKRKVADIVWKAFGEECTNYVEPFFGSGAVLLGRPWGPCRTETVNDRDGYVANFWRAVQMDPEGVAKYANCPVNEIDCTARHAWLVNQVDLVPRLEGDPEYFDSKIAGFWLHGVNAWIGGGFCSGKGAWRSVDGKLIHLGDRGQGVNKQRIHLGDRGQGVNKQRIHLGDRGQGVNKQRIHLGNRGQGVLDWMRSLADRLRYTRVACGDWSRVCGKTPTWKIGVTAVFLDPPYSSRDRVSVYSSDSFTVADDVQAWCESNSDNKRMRIVLCGYEGDYPRIEGIGWRKVAWKAAGGYSSRNAKGNDNCTKERIWFSPHCVNGGVE